MGPILKADVTWGLWLSANIINIFIVSVSGAKWTLQWIAANTLHLQNIKIVKFQSLKPHVHKRT